MRGSPMALVAAAALLAGVAGCSLPEVLPLADGPTAGPSPYGPWYEQHWATNAVLLAASDQPEGEIDTGEFGLSDDDSASDALEQSVDGPQPALGSPEANARNGDPSAEFSNSSPYQFPSSSFAPAPVEQPAVPAPGDPQLKPAPATGGPIRY